MDRVQYESLIIQDVSNLNKAGELELAPWYQRRSVWTRPQKSYLINTLHEQKPIPAIYIRHSIDLEKEKSIREIVDGQQRMRAILEYLGDEFGAKHPKHARRVKFSQLKKSERQTFLLTSLPVAYLLGANDADVIDIFGRINSVAKTLNAQEKRNSLFSGEMKQFTLQHAAERVNLWRNYSIFTGNQIARMDEVQFISDLVFNLYYGLSDFSQARLAQFYDDNDETFARQAGIEKRLNRTFDFIVSLEPSLIRETIFSRSPLFFSLFIVLADTTNLTRKRKKIEGALVDVDARFYDPKTKADDAFVEALTSTTQRIKQRRIRDKYLRKYI